MQKQKGNIREKILQVAKVEFLTYGFKNASMRIIAQKSEVGLSNIYNYFKNKDELFGAIVCPVMDVVKQALNIHNNTDFFAVDYFESTHEQEKDLKLFLNILDKYTDELKLLLLCSSGSSYEDYKTEITEYNTKSGIVLINRMKQLHPQINADISPFFIYSISSWWITVLTELVSRQLSHEEIEHFVSEYIAFETAGWKSLFKI